MTRFDLRAEEWGVVALMSAKHGRGAKRGDERKVLIDIFHILRTGAP